MSKIPSDEELDRASQMMEQQFHNLDVVERNVTEHFKTKCPLHIFYILPQGEDRFRAYVFFVKDKDIEECKKSGIVETMKDFVFEELGHAGRGKRDEITVAFELDSDENVTANYEGDYYLRLR